MSSIVFGLLVLAFLVIGIFSIEAWPISSYPMFSTSFDTSFSSILYLEIESETGEKQKWKPRKAFLRKQVDDYLKTVLLDKEKNVINTNAIDTERATKVVSHFYRLYCTEHKNVSSVRKVNLIHESFSMYDRSSKQQLLKAFEIEELNQTSTS